MPNKKGIILTITLALVMVFVIIAGIAIILITNQGRISEYQIKRIKAFYTAEAALTHVLQSFRTGTPPSGPFTWNDILPTPVNGYNADVTIEGTPGTGPKGTRILRVRVDY